MHQINQNDAGNNEDNITSWLRVAVEYFKTLSKNIQYIEYRRLIDAVLISQEGFTNQLSKMKFILSQLEAILHDQKISIGLSPLSQIQIATDTEILINNGHELLRKNIIEAIEIPILRQRQSYSSLTAAECNQKGLKLRAEQKYLKSINYHNGQYHKFLQDIWCFLIEKRFCSKKIFISYAWPNLHQYPEKWTKTYLKALAKDLSQAGIQILIDVIHSGPGCELRPFMHLIADSDHVIFANTDTIKEKLNWNMSGAKNEMNEIVNCINNKSDNFVIIANLNNNICFPEQINSGTVVPVLEYDYLDGVKSFIKAIYEFDEQVTNEFEIYWQQKIIFHRLNSKLHNVPLSYPLFNGRKEQLDTLHKIVAELNEQNNIGICYGPKGIGKTEIVKQYIWDNYHLYKAVYWFDIKRTPLAEVLNQNFNINSLLVFDNTNNADITVINNHFLHTKQKIIAICFDNVKGFPSVKISEFCLADAKQYIYKNLGAVKTLRHEKQIDQMIDLIGTTPIDLSRACGCIQRNTGISIEDFNEIYQTFGKDILKKCPLPLRQIDQASLMHSHDLIPPSKISKFNLEKFYKNKAPHVNTLYSFMTKLQDIIFMLAQYPHYKYIDNVLNHLIINENYFNLLMSNIDNKRFWYCYLQFALSHIIAVADHVRDVIDIQGFINEFSDELSSNQGNNLTLLLPKQILSVHNVKNPPVAPRQTNDPLQELKGYTAQQALDQMRFVKNNTIIKPFSDFLHDMWLYSVNPNERTSVFSKLVLIIYSPSRNDNDDELWHEGFISTLVDHLKHTGLQIRLKQALALEPSDLVADHILLIGTKSIASDIGPDGKIYQYLFSLKQKIAQAITDGKINRDNPKARPILPVLLTNENPLPLIFHELAELNTCPSSDYKKPPQDYLQEIKVCQQNYLAVLKTLLRTMNGYDFCGFDNYWNKCLITHKLKNNLWKVPTQNPHFVGRTKHLSELHNKLHQKVEKPLLLTACSGMGGVGKTHLAIEYAHEYRCFYTEIYWLNASIRSALLDDLVNLGKDKCPHVLNKNSLIENAYSIKEWLQNDAPNNITGGILIILDDASKQEVVNEQKFYNAISKDNNDSSSARNNLENMQNYILDLVPAKNCKVLITSRHMEWLGNKITVDIFDITESIDLASKIIGTKKVQNEINSVKELFNDILGNLPLAINIACAYIKNNNISFQDYINILKSDGFNALPSLHAAIQLALNKIKEENPFCIELLNSFSPLYCTNISTDITDKIFNIDKSKSFLSKFHLENAKRTIFENNLIAIDDNTKIISLHCLVHQYIRINLGFEFFNYLIKISYLILSNFPFQSFYTTQFYNVSQQFENHLYQLLSDLQIFIDKAMTLSEQDTYIQIKTTARLFELQYIPRTLILLADVAMSKGYYPDAKKYLEKMIKTAESSSFYKSAQRLNTLIETEIETLFKNPEVGEYYYNILLIQAKSLLAMVEVNLGNSVKARKIYFECIEFFGNNVHLEIGKIYSSLAETYRNSGRYNNADIQLLLLKLAWRRINKSTIEDKAIKLILLENLVPKLASEDDITYIEDILNQKIKDFGENDPQVAITLTLLSSKYASKGMYEKSLYYIKKAIEIETAVFKTTLHIEVVKCQLLLAGIYLEFKKFNEAKDILELAIINQNVHYRLTDNKMFSVHYLLGNIYLKLSDPYKAKSNLDNALKYSKLTYEEDIFNRFDFSSLIADICNTAFNCYLNNSLDKAIAFYELAVHFGGNTVNIFHNLGCFYHLRGDTSLAYQAFNRAINIEPHSSTYCDYGLLLLNCKNYEEAIKMFLLAIAHSEDDSSLIYAQIEKPLLDINLQQEITEELSLNIQPLYIAHYWLTICFKSIGFIIACHAVLEKLKVLIDNKPTSLHFRLLNYLLLYLDMPIEAKKYQEQAIILREQEKNIPKLEGNISANNEHKNEQPNALTINNNPSQLVNSSISDLHSIDEQAFMASLKEETIKLSLYPEGMEKLEERNFADALANFDKFLECFPNDYSCYAARGIAKWNLNCHEDAIKDLSKAIELAPKIAKYYIERGSARAEISDIIGAISDYKRAIEIEPDNVIAYRRLSEQNLKVSNYDIALQLIEKGLAIKPNDIFYNQRGYIRYKLGEYTLALEDFNKAISLMPQEAHSYRDRAITLKCIGDIYKAENDFKKALELYQAISIKYEWTHISLSFVFGHLGKYNEALNQANNAVIMAPKYVLAYLRRANAYRQLRKYLFAVKDYDIYLKYYPTSLDCLCDRAYTYYLMKEYAKGLYDVNKAISLNANYVESYFIKALLLIATNQLNEAINHCEHLFKIAPLHFKSILLKSAIHCAISEHGQLTDNNETKIIDAINLKINLSLINDVIETPINHITTDEEIASIKLLQNLLTNNQQVITKHQCKEAISIIFDSEEVNKAFTTHLSKIGIFSHKKLDKPKSLKPSQSLVQHEKQACINISATEYNLIMDDQKAFSKRFGVS